MLTLLLLLACAKDASPPPAAEGSMAPALVVDGDGLLLSWLEPTAHGRALRFARFDGQGWERRYTVIEGEELLANWADVPHVVRRRDGGFAAVWAVKRGGHAYDARVGLSDDGEAWQVLPLHDDASAVEHGFVSLVSTEGGMRALWLDGRAMAASENGPTQLLARTLVAPGGALGNVERSPESVVDARVCDCCSTAAVSARGAVVAAYRDRADDELRDVRVVRLADDGSVVEAALPVDGWRIPGCPVNGPALAASDDLVALAWFTMANEQARVRAAMSDDGGRTFAPVVEIDAPADGSAPLGRVDVALLDDGSAAVSWISARGEDATLRVRRVTRAGAGAPLDVARVSAVRATGMPQLERLGGELFFVYTVVADGKPAGLATARLPSSSLPRP